MFSKLFSRVGGRSSISSILVFLIGCGGSSAAGGAAGGVVGPSGCGMGGLNDNQKGVGNQFGGVQLDIGDIAVAPSGAYVVFQMEGDLAVGWADTGAVQKLPVASPTKLVFSSVRDVVYVGSQADGRLHAVDVRKLKDLWVTPLAVDSSMKIASSKDDTRVLTATSDGKVTLLDAGTGAVVIEKTMSGAVDDLEILPDDKRALVVPTHTWVGAGQTEPLTVVTVLSLAEGATRTFDVPNCSDNIVVTPSGDRAFLAPTTCQKDPISYIDLTPGAEVFLKNLPGFGPVAMAPDGVTAVGFLDAANADAALFDDPSQKPDPAGTRYHLMVIDTQSVSYKFFPFGEELPRYAITPDGDVLLVDSFASAPARLFDTKAGVFNTIDGPPVNLDSFVISSDSSHAYVLQTTLEPADPKQPSGTNTIVRSLYDINVIKATSEVMNVGFQPLNINIAPNDKTLFLREDSANVCVFSLETRACGARISGEEAPPVAP